MPGIIPAVDFVLLSVPFFFLLLVGELAYARFRGVRVYRFPDTLSNLASGVGSQLTGLLAVALSAFVYEALRRRFAVTDLAPHPILAWILALVGVDFFYYWWHRASHRINLFWATHSVHHQSEEYNFSVALRQSWFSGFFSWIFYLPLALLGVPYVLYAASAALSLLYQYWIHTRLIGKLGPLEVVLNTPSHHRVHHGSNREYLDKNYGATLIVWDRLFGTFTEENAPVTFGVVNPVRTWNAVRANFRPWRDFELRDAFRPPGWGKGEPEETAGRAAWEGPSKTAPQLVAATAGIIAITAGAIWVVARQADLSSLTVVAAGAALLVAMAPLGSLLDSEG